MVLTETKEVADMDEDVVLYRKEDGIAVVTFNRPEKLNALNWECYERMASIVEQIKRDDEVGAVIVTGNGRAFCAGADVTGGEMPGIRRRKEMTEANPSYKAVERASAPTFDVGASMESWRFNSIPKVTVAAINGPTVGLGCEITLHCDIRIAAEDARWGEVFVLRGMVPDTGAGTWLLPRIVGLSKALELVCSGEIIDAQEMLRVGLVDQVVPNDELLPAAKEMAKKFLRGSPLAVQMAKQLIYRGLERTALDHLRDNRIALDLIANTEDHTEGTRSFLEKRTPRWKRR